MSRAIRGSGFPLGIFSVDGDAPRVGAAFEGSIIDVSAILGDEVFRAPSLNGFLTRGPEFWQQTADAIESAVSTGTAQREDAASAVLHLPIEVADFVDFFSSLVHATNAGNILRPSSPGLQPNWREIPVGYHGRAGTVVVSGTPVVRPFGQVKLDGLRPQFLPTRKLDVEVELGFVVGVPSELGTRVRTGDFERHVFGSVIVIDWSARDIQAFEAQPLGPFLGKSFGTTISPWVVPLSLLKPLRVPAPERDPEPLPHLAEAESWNLPIRFELLVNGEVVSRPTFEDMYWSPSQELAHLTSNGASLRTGDLYASGTISGRDRDEWGSLLELTANGAAPVTLPSGRRLGYLQDGDVVEVRAWATGADGRRIDFGVAAGTIVPSREQEG